MESPTLGGHQISIIQASHERKYIIQKQKVPYLGIWMSQVQKNILPTQKARTCGATQRPEKKGLQTERLRRQMETTEEREERFINALKMHGSGTVAIYGSIWSFIAYTNIYR